MSPGFQVALWIPILFVVVCAFLIVVPCYVAPYEVLFGLLITLTGIPAYWVGVRWQNKPIWFRRGLGNFENLYFVTVM
jgi:L-type amino acid transporter 5